MYTSSWSRSNTYDAYATTVTTLVHKNESECTACIMHNKNTIPGMEIVPKNKAFAMRCCRTLPW